MSSTPLRATSPPSYATIQKTNWQRQFSDLLDSPQATSTQIAAAESSSPQPSSSTAPPPLLPSIITSAPFRTSAGTWFFPQTPLVVVPPRQTPPAAVTDAATTTVESESDDNSELHCSKCCGNTRFKKMAKALILGQIMSIALCFTGVASELLARRGYSAPAAQSFPTYFLLLFIYGFILVCRSGDRNALNVLRARGWKYAMLAFVDVQANYLIVYAYQFTNLTSIQILDCSTIPIVMTLSYLFLSVRYMLSHLIGVIICLVGIGLVIAADASGGVRNDQSDGAIESGSNRVLGDALCIGAALLYSIANVSEEALVKSYDRFEYLGMVGLFGCIISGAQSAIFEHSNLTSFRWSTNAILELALFTACMLAFYSLVSLVMTHTSALMFNLVVLTADFYSILAGIFIFAYSFKILYLISFIVVLIGSIVYSVRKTEERSRDEVDFISRLIVFCCPCQSCAECRPRAAYSVREAQQRTPSIHSETPQSSRSTPSTS